MTSGQKSAKSNVFVTVAALIVLSVYPPMWALAQDNGNELSRNGMDPTEARSRIDFLFADVRGVRDRDLFGFTISGNYAFARWGSFGVEVPYLYTNADFSELYEDGWGDVKLEAMAVVYNRPGERAYKSVAVGAEFLTNTGDYEGGTGLGYYAIAPYVAASFPLAENLFFAPIIRDYVSLGGDEDAGEINELRVQLLSVYEGESGFWIGLQPEVIVDLTGFKFANYPLRTTIGKMVNENLGFAAQLTTDLAGESRVDYLASFRMLYLFD